MFCEKEFGNNDSNGYQPTNSNQPFWLNQHQQQHQQAPFQQGASQNGMFSEEQNQNQNFSSADTNKGNNNSIQNEEQDDSKYDFDFEDLVILKRLNNGRYPVFLAHSPALMQSYAIKLFPYKNNEIAPGFINESQFRVLDHPNVVKILACNPEKDINLGDKKQKISYIVITLAPYGDFLDLIIHYRVPFDEILVRTYFHQLIEGLEYLHESGVCHLDIKTENLLLGADFKLKITDFDLSYIAGDEKIKSFGTKFFRAPELILKQCEYPEKADIFSAAMVVFVLLSGGSLAQKEDQPYHDNNLYELMHFDNEKFWDLHCEIIHKPKNFFSDSFKLLFNWMTMSDPVKRASLKDIKSTTWYNQKIYTETELQLIMSGYVLSV